MRQKAFFAAALRTDREVDFWALLKILNESESGGALHAFLREPFGPRSRRK